MELPVTESNGNLPPDFVMLGRQSIWPRQEWQDAWELLAEPRVWFVLLEMTDKLGARPTDAAAILAKALDRVGVGRYR